MFEWASLLLSCLTPIILALIAVWQAKMMRAAAVKVEEVKTELKISGTTLKKDVESIHTAVNSEREKMVNEIRALNAVILELRVLIAGKKEV